MGVVPIERHIRSTVLRAGMALERYVELVGASPRRMPPAEQRLLLNACRWPSRSLPMREFVRLVCTLSCQVFIPHVHLMFSGRVHRGFARSTGRDDIPILFEFVGCCHDVFIPCSYQVLTPDSTHAIPIFLEFVRLATRFHRTFMPRVHVRRSMLSIHTNSFIRSTTFAYIVVIQTFSRFPARGSSQHRAYVRHASRYSRLGAQLADVRLGWLADAPEASFVVPFDVAGGGGWQSWVLSDVCRRKAEPSHSGRRRSDPPLEFCEGRVRTVAGVGWKTKPLACLCPIQAHKAVSRWSGGLQN